MLECLYILTFVLPGTILAASAGVTCVVGKSMAITRQALDEIGGFEAFAQVLAEDQSIGLAVAQTGYRVALSPIVVHNIIERRTVSGAGRRQVRWGKIRYSFSRLRYTSEFLCNPLPLLLVAAIAPTISGRSAVFPSALLAVSAIAARIMQAGALRSLTGAKLPVFSLALVPVQDCIQAAAQFVPYFSSYVDWRGFRTRLGRGTQILDPRQAAKWGPSVTP
jgi:ceramide glucosyltransferase